MDSSSWLETQGPIPLGAHLHCLSMTVPIPAQGLWSCPWSSAGVSQCKNTANPWVKITVCRMCYGIGRQVSRAWSLVEPVQGQGLKVGPKSNISCHSGGVWCHFTMLQEAGQDLGAGCPLSHTLADQECHGQDWSVGLRGVYAQWSFESQDLCASQKLGCLPTYLDLQTWSPQFSFQPALQAMAGIRERMVI